MSTLVLEAAHCIAVRLHLRVVIARLLHDLIDDELRVTAHVEALDAELDGDAGALRRASYSAMLFEVGKCKRITYCMCSPRGEMKRRPAPASVFITDPSKYIVQHSPWICGGAAECRPFSHEVSQDLGLDRFAGGRR